MWKNHREAKEEILSAVEVKSKFGAEFRRFSFERLKPGRFSEFYALLQHVHLIPNVDVLVMYLDVQGVLLPINNDDNYHKAISTARPLLRILIQRKEEANSYESISSGPTWKNGSLATALRHLQQKQQKPGVVIGLPQNFRPVSSIVDVDVLPEWLRRVRLHRHGSGRPLGLYIRDGAAIRLTREGPERVRGVFISRVVPGGLAESTGLLAANDEVLEVNGVSVARKSLDQVTDMMIANSHNLILTVRPIDQRYNIMRTSDTSFMWPFNMDKNFNHYNVDEETEKEEEDVGGEELEEEAEEQQQEQEQEESEEEDLIFEAGWDPRPVPRYELHLGMRQKGPLGPSSSLWSLSTTDSEQGEPENRTEVEEEEGIVLTL